MFKTVICISSSKEKKKKLPTSTALEIWKLQIRLTPETGMPQV